uniref:Spectrin beta chain n=1 Tax=Ascaris suum TaxID=6253 RepID=F1KPH2_ASCSU
MELKAMCQRIIVELLMVRRSPYRRRPPSERRIKNHRSQGMQSWHDRKPLVLTIVNSTTLHRYEDALLSDMIKLYRFVRECDQFEAWANDTENMLIDSASSDNVQAFRMKFDKLESEINTNGRTQLKRINSMAEELMNEGHSHSNEIRKRRDAVNRLWERIQELCRVQLGHLEKAERVAAFNETCEDARSWMADKFDLLDQKVDPNDPKAVAALQKRYQNLGKDLKPLEEKIRYLRELADKVKKEHPEEAAKIEAMIDQLVALHSDLKQKAAARIEEAEQTQGQQMFDGAVKNLQAWIEKTKNVLADKTRPVDIASAEDLLKKHYELKEDIDSKKYEFEYVRDLGKRLLQKNPSLNEVRSTLARLDSEQRALMTMWAEKEQLLKEMLDLQLLNTEAERIDAATKGHEAFLEITNLGDSVESVENLLKRHGDFEAKLRAQEDRLKAFAKSADQLVQAGHSESPFIQQRKDDVLARRAAVHKAAGKRRAQLEASLVYQNLRRNIQELSQWIAEKKKIANDNAHKDAASIAMKLLKHSAFEAELKANAARLEQVNKDGNALIAQQHYESPSIKRLLDGVNREWAELCKAAEAKGERLRQADAQKGLNRSLDDAHLKLDDIQNALQSKDLGSDLRGVKDLLQKHGLVEKEMSVFDKRIKEITDRGDALIKEGHFDAPSIKAAIKKLTDRFESLKEPARLRRAALEESQKWHKLSFDVDCEMQWIAEKVPIAASEDSGRSLTEATNMQKKHEQLESEVNSRLPHIKATLKRGEDLIKEKHYAHDQIKAKCEQLAGAWAHLGQLVRKRRNLLEWALKEEQYLFDAAEVESWMNEKRPALSSEDYGKDEDAAQKLLAKHKALQADMSTYRQWLEKLAMKCAELKKSVRSGGERFENRQMELEKEFDALWKMAEERRKQLENAVHLYQYLRESQELELWINEQLQIAMSEDYGQDYEHLKELQNRFEDFKQSVKTGSERFVHCEAAANSLLKRSPPFAREILKRQEKLRSVWTLLLDYIESRDQKLDAAEELHRFNRDVAENQERIAEKHASIPSELGKDIKQVHSLWLKHEAFEHQLTAMEQQLQELLEESARLKAAYPGGNAEHITAQQAALAEAWQDLQDATVCRRDMLKAAYDLQRFYVNARDLIAWTEIVITDMQSEQAIHDLQGAEWLQKEHLRLQAEIEAREPEFTRLAQRGQQMIAKEHYASADIAVKLKQVAEALDRVRNEWSMRAEWLSQVREWHAFQREAKQTLAAIAARQSTLRCAQVGGTVDEVENQIKKLDTFQKALSTLDDRVTSLHKTAKQLIAARHMESAKIEQWMKQVENALAQLRSEVGVRRTLLADALKLARFNSDVAEMENWIDEKQKRIRMETDRQAKLTSIEDKMKRLQKHQAMEAELTANSARIEQIREQAKELASKRTADSEDIMKRSSALLRKWNELVAMSQEQSNALEEARDLLNFNQLVERVLQWIKEKELLVNAAEMGRDMEHCQLLIEKLDGTKADASVDESSVESANKLGAKLVAQRRSSQKAVQQQLLELNNAWKALQGKLAAYRVQLRAALEVHAFNRDVDDTCERIQEKVSLVTIDDLGKDLATVEALIRKQEAVERDMTVIHEKLKAHDNEAQKLLSKDPPLRETIIESLRKLEVSWQKLAELATSRGNRLMASGELHRFFDAVRKTEAWAVDTLTRLGTQETPQSAAHAESLIAKHVEKLAEIDGRQREMSELREWGAKLSNEQPDHKGEIQRALKRLQNLEHQLRQAWEAKNLVLARGRNRQLFSDQAARAEEWLLSKEAFLKQADMGESVDAVDTLLKKHVDFEKTLIAQSDKIDSLRRAADELIERDPDNRNEVEQRRDCVLARHAALMDACKRRHSLLTENRKLHEFIDTCGELMTWISAKIQLAYDESFLDQTNLRSKLQKHLVFEAELDANEGRVKSTVGIGEKLIKEKHYASDSVARQIAEVNGGWLELRRKSALKKRRLCEANEAYQLNRRLEDLDKWLERVENDLSNEDHGNDYISVEALIKKQDDLDAEIASRAASVQQCIDKAREFEKQGYANTKESLEMAKAVEQRYFGLKEPCQIRRDNLRDALAFYEWISEAEEQLEWIGDKMRQAISTDYGDTLHAVQSLTKKHALLEEEINSRQSLISKTEMKAMAMIKNGHFASNEIQKVLDELSSLLLSIKQLIQERSQKLADSLSSQQYYAEANEAEQWMRERLPLVANHDAGKDQAAAESHLRRLTTLENDVNKFATEVERLRKATEAMLAREHFDATNLTSKQIKLEKLYKDLKEECAHRRVLLVDASRYHAFVRQIDDLARWLGEKFEHTKQENYGRDLEDCQKLVAEFDQVMRELTSAGERVAAVQRMQEELLRSGHPFGASIRAKGTDLQHLWSAVNEAATERQQALQGAIQVHKFDQDADETLGWLEEKEAHQVAVEGEDISGADLPALKQLMIKHDEFMHGVSAVEKQVGDLCREAERLISLYPDTKEHLEVRRMEMEEQLKDVVNASRTYLERLQQMQNLQSYFQEHRDLIAWIRRLQHTVTSETLPNNVEGCEALMVRHAEYQSEMNARRPAVEEFLRKGRSMIASQHVLSQEISTKVNQLASAFDLLCDIWKERLALYEENLDVQKWKRDANVLDSWLNEKEELLSEEWRKVDSVDDADNRIRNFDDFLVTLEAQGEKFEGLKRLTLLERAYSMQRKTESERIRAEEERNEPKKENIKTFEKQNKLQDRRKERERRMTQEVSLLKPSPSFTEESVQYASQTLPHPRRGTEPVPCIRTSSFESKDTIGNGGATTVTVPDIVTALDVSRASQTSSTLMPGEELTPQPMQRAGSSRKTPTFTTRRSHSLKRMKTWEDYGKTWEDYGSIDMHGHLDRKQDLQSGGKKATIRTWKRYYTILCGQLLCFFKDEESFMENSAASAPVNILHAECNACPEYMKKKNAFRLKMQDGSEYLFACSDEKLMLEWVAKIKFHASLAPAQQLRSFDRGETPPLHAPPPRPGEILRRHTTEVGSPSHDPPVFELASDEKRPSISSETFEQTTTLIVPDMSSLSRNLMSPQAAVSQFSSLPRSSKGFLPTHYPKQSTLSACGSSSSISSTTIPPIVKSGSHNGEIATPQRKIKSTSYKQSIYESVYGEEQQQQVIVGEAQRVSQTPYAAMGSMLVRETISTAYSSQRQASTESAQGSQASTLQNGDEDMNAPQHHGSSDSGSLPSRQAKGDGSDFIAWVESQGVGASGNVGASPQQQHDETDSVKKKKAFSFFKRGSRHGKENKQ